MATETKSRPTTFVRRYRDYRLVKDPTIWNHTPQGVRYETIPGEAVEFDEQGRFETDDEKLIEWLRGHDQYNSPIGFWELGNAPDEPKPTTQHQVEEITRLTAAGDVPKLQELIEAERATHNRENVIVQAQAGIDALEMPPDEAA